MRGIWVAVLLAPWLGAGCGGGDDDAAGKLSGTGGSGASSPGGAGGDVAGVGGTGGTGGSGGGAGTGGDTPSTVRGCSDLFDQAQLVDYAFDISADEWAKIDYEFRNRDALKAAGIDFKTYHPIVFHYGGETVTDAMVRLKGDSSWRITLMEDGDKARMQFVVSFEEVNPAGKFHGLSKIVLDMPNDDETFMQERLGFTAMAELFGQPAPCANNARVTINGQYYGLFVNEEHVGGGFIRRVFPEAPNGDLIAGGYTFKTNELMPNKDKLKAFWAASDTTSMAAVVDLESSVTEWAAEAMINEADGYVGGAHNFYLYDYPGLGYRWLIDDSDAAFAWMGRSDDNPIYWWMGHSVNVGPHYLIVIADSTWRARYIEALRTQLGRWDVARLQGWIDAWEAQIADAAAQDPHRMFSVEDHLEAIAATRQVVVDRAAYLTTFLGCQDGTGDVSDADGDGFAWCNDCNDANAGVSPGAAELCANLVDDNCNFLVDAAEACQ